MCLTVPRKVEKVTGATALLQDGREVSLKLVSEVKPGDYLLVQADVAIQKITREETQAMKELMMEDHE